MVVELIPIAVVLAGVGLLGTVLVFVKSRGSGGAVIAFTDGAGGRRRGRRSSSGRKRGDGGKALARVSSDVEATSPK